jgi:caa(3)-type oxidase subunit IV
MGSSVAEDITKMAKTPLQAAHGHGGHGDGHGGHEIHPNGMYIRTALVLAVLMGLTILAAQVDFGHFVSSKLPFLNGYYVNNFIALGIAIVKCYIVVMFFMHVKWASSLGKLWAFIGFFFLTGFVALLCDYFFRTHEATPTWQAGRQETALPRAIGSTDQLPLPAGEENVQNRIPKASMN